MPPVVFEPTITASERPQSYALDGAATGTGIIIIIIIVVSVAVCQFYLSYLITETLLNYSTFFIASRVKTCPLTRLPPPPPSRHRHVIECQSSSVSKICDLTTT